MRLQEGVLLYNGTLNLKKREMGHRGKGCDTVIGRVKVEKGKELPPSLQHGCSGCPAGNRVIKEKENMYGMEIMDEKGTREKS